MELKTIGDLKNLIKKEGNSLKIGSLVFEYVEGGDIDIKLKDNLIAWFSKPEDVDLLEGKYLSLSNDADFLKKDINNLAEENNNLKEKLITLEKENTLLSVIKKDSETAIGKVEAYEKLLIGRSLTISA